MHLACLYASAGHHTGAHDETKATVVAPDLLQNCFCGIMFSDEIMKLMIIDYNHVLLS